MVGNKLVDLNINTVVKTFKENRFSMKIIVLKMMVLLMLSSCSKVHSSSGTELGFDAFSEKVVDTKKITYINADHDFLLHHMERKEKGEINLKELNLFKYRTPFDRITGITQLKKLELLKIYLKSDKYIKQLTSLIKLKELYLTGNIKKLPIFQNSLEKLYLYNTEVSDFSFLRDSNIKYLYVVTKSFRDKKWDKLRKKYPKVKIRTDSLLFMPIVNPYRDRSYYKPNFNFCMVSLSDIANHTYDNDCDEKIKFDGLYVRKLTFDIIEYSRDNNFCPFYEKGHVKYLKYLLEELNIDFNVLYEKKTILDCVMDKKDKEFIKYLRKKGVKRACELLKTECQLERNKLLKE